MSTKTETVREKTEASAARAQDAATSMFKAAPTLPLDQFFAMQRANMETLAETQRVVLDYAQTVGSRQAELMKAMVERFNAVMHRTNGKDRPDAYTDEVKAVMEKSMADLKETMDLGMKAQHEVFELLMKQAAKNLDDVKGNMKS